MASSNPMRCNPAVLLDLSTPFDESKVDVLDTVVKAMLSSTDCDTRNVANQVLEKFKNLPDVWRFVAIILQKSSDSNTKYFALQILENCIQTRWKILPDREKIGIKQYVSEMTLQLAANEFLCQNEKHFVNKVNENLIQIVKQEWPHNWPNFITELCKSSRTNQSICENNMKLLNLLSEEVFDFGRDCMASTKVEYLMEQMTVQFQEVFDLCMFILQSYISNPNAVRNSLVKQTLQCLFHFLKWIPYGYIFELYTCGDEQTYLVDHLLTHFWDPVIFRIDCVKCLTEISSLKLDAAELQAYHPRLVDFMAKFIRKLKSLPSSTINYDDPSKVVGQMRLFWETFYSQLAICLTAFLKNYRENVCETVTDTEGLFFLFRLLVSMTYINHDETFKICLDYWNLFLEELMQEVSEAYARTNFEDRSLPGSSFMKNFSNVKNITNGTDTVEPLDDPENYSSRLKAYQCILDEVRNVMVQRMAKPKEVYIQFDQETEEVVRDIEVDTDEIELYNQMRIVLILLTNLGQNSTRKIILKALEMECEQDTDSMAVWNPTLLNRICYSVGAISGAMSEIVERDFLVVIVKNLLQLCEMKRQKEAKATVASCIMLVVGQYSRFLKAHWKFLKTVANKLFEFMHEDFPGVKDMACETFLKISIKCKDVMAMEHEAYDKEQFLDEIVASWEVQASELDDKQVLLYYEAIAHIISAANAKLRPKYIHLLMNSCNTEWDRITNAIKQNPGTLYDTKVAKLIVKALRINGRIAKANGAGYTAQLMYIYQEMLQIYQLCSARIMNEVQMGGEAVIKYLEIKTLYLIKHEILNLVETYIDVAARETTDLKGEIVDKLLGPLLMTLLQDYRDNAPTTRDYQVLSLLSVLMVRLDFHMSRALPNIFSYVFDCTVEMIKQDFRSFPDHRQQFYEMLKNCNKYCFDGLFALPPEKLQAYVECLVWALKHELPAVAEQGLQVTLQFMEKLISERKELLTGFCSRFYYSLMQETLSVLTDRLHRSGFHYQTLILRLLLQLVELKIIDQSETVLRKEVVMKNLVDMLNRSFETVNEKQVEAFVLDLFNYCTGDNVSPFQTHIRDFLISLKEFAGSDELFEMEKNEALRRAREKEEKRRMMIPGMASQFESISTVRDMEDS